MSLLRRVLPVSLLLTMTMMLVATPIVIAGTKYDDAMNNHYPIWYVYAQVWGYHYDYWPYDFYDSHHDGWAYAIGWPILWKYAADTVQGWMKTYYCRTKVTGHFINYGGWFDAYAEIYVYSEEPA